MTLGQKRIFSFEGRGSGSHYVEASFWRRLWTCRQTDCWMNDEWWMKWTASASADTKLLLYQDKSIHSPKYVNFRHRPNFFRTCRLRYKIYAKYVFEIYTPYSLIFSLKQMFLFVTFLSERSGDADVESWILLSTVPVRLLYHNSNTKELWPRHTRRTHSVTERFVDDW